MRYTAEPMAAVTLAFLHYLFAFVLVGALMVELVLLRDAPSVATVRTLLRMDSVYGAAAGLLLVVGFLRVFYTEKGAAYYFHSGAFIAKIALFAVVGILSIYPTVQFVRWRKALAQQQAPVLDDGKRRSLRLIVHIELTLIVFIIVCASMMARGIGFIG
jgi:putative membrane protein